MKRQGKKSPNGTGRLGRNKKEKIMQTDIYKSSMEELSQKGITETDIQMIYDRCRERKQSMISRDTLIFKLNDLLKYFEDRNNGLKPETKGFISKEDVIAMIMKNPRIITSDINNNIIPKCQILTAKKGTTREANIAIKSNPGIFRKSAKTIKEGR